MRWRISDEIYNVIQELCESISKIEKLITLVQMQYVLAYYKNLESFATTETNSWGDLLRKGIPSKFEQKKTLLTSDSRYETPVNDTTQKPAV